MVSLPVGDERYDPIGVWVCGREGAVGQWCWVVGVRQVLSGGRGQHHIDAMTRGPGGRPKSGSGFAGQDERNIRRPSIISGTSTVMMFQSVSLSIPRYPWINGYGLR